MKILNKDRVAGILKTFQKKFTDMSNDQEYLMFSQFIQECFIPKNAYFNDTGSFRNVNLELMSRIKKKIDAHPWLWTKFFMIDPDGYAPESDQDHNLEKDINFTPDTGQTKEEIKQIRKELDKSLKSVTGGTGGAKSLYQIKTINLHEVLKGLQIIGHALNMSTAQLIELEAVMLTYIGRHFPDNAVNIGVADKDVPEWYRRMLDNIMREE